jgi:hypothetical protein
MRRDQEGSQRQEFRILFKLLNVTGKQVNHSGRHCGGFHMVGPMKDALRRRRFSSDVEVIGAVQNWLKTRPKNFLF